MLTEDQIAHYVREGYVLAPGLVQRHVVERAAAKAQSALAATYEIHLASGGGRQDWQPVSFRKQDWQQNDPDIHGVLWDRGILTAAEQLLGTPPCLLHGMLAAVPPGGGRGLPWHQDNMYGQFLEGALNLFVALVEITPDMGGLWVAPHSHLHGVLPNHTCDGKGEFAQGHREADEEPANPFPMPTMQPGDACIFSRYTLHRSTPNRTDKLRLAYAAQMHAAHARMVDGSQPRDPCHMKEIAQHFERAAAAP